MQLTAKARLAVEAESEAEALRKTNDVVLIGSDQEYLGDGFELDEIGEDLGAIPSIAGDMRGDAPWAPKSGRAPEACPSMWTTAADVRPARLKRQ